MNVGLQWDIDTLPLTITMKDQYRQIILVSMICFSDSNKRCVCHILTIIFPALRNGDLPNGEVVFFFIRA
jgi:hypothetical protein